jgi:hypothetical protein
MSSGVFFFFVYNYYKFSLIRSSPLFFFFCTFKSAVILKYVRDVTIVICTTSYESHTFFHEFAD